MIMLKIKHYQTVKEKFIYGYFVVFLGGASLGFVVRLLVEQYVIAFLDIVAIAIVIGLVYDYEKRHDVKFTSLVLFWMISIFMFYYIYHLGYDITIFQLMPIPVAAAMTLDTKTYKRHSFLFLLLFFLLMSYGFYHKENYTYLQDTKFVAQGFIILMFSFASGFVYHYSINKFNEKLQETNTLLSQSNIEKTALLKEVHHRVKNNLNMMTSILGLQEDTAKTEDMRVFITQNRLRIKSIALVHELLYKESNFKSIQVNEYIQNLIRHITTLTKNDKLTLTVNIEKITFNTDDIIHIGIIINELMTNSLKYAFDNNGGNIDLSLHHIENHYELDYKDNGKGADGKELDNDGFGTNLIKLSAEHLNGTIEIYAEKGLHTKITFRGTQI